MTTISSHNGSNLTTAQAIHTSIMCMESRVEQIQKVLDDLKLDIRSTKDMANGLKDDLAKKPEFSELIDKITLNESRVGFYSNGKEIGYVECYYPQISQSELDRYQYAKCVNVDTSDEKNESFNFKRVVQYLANKSYIPKASHLGDFLRMEKTIC